MSTDHRYEHDEQDYGRKAFTRTKREGAPTSMRSSKSQTRGKSPQSVNGMHKRRRRKMSW